VIIDKKDKAYQSQSADAKEDAEKGHDFNTDVPYWSDV
jgi:hypothetical protein